MRNGDGWFQLFKECTKTYCGESFERRQADAASGGGGAFPLIELLLLKHHLPFYKGCNYLISKDQIFAKNNEMDQ